MTLVHSVAAFSARCAEIDDTGQLAHQLNRQGIDTFFTLAFAIGTPSQPPTDDAFCHFSNRVFGVASLGQNNKLRRLLFESQTFVLAQLKLTVSGDQTDASRKLPLPEKLG